MGRPGVVMRAIISRIVGILVVAAGVVVITAINVVVHLARANHIFAAEFTCSGGGGN